MSAFSTSWKYIRRSPYQSFVAILTMFLTLLLSGIFFLTSAVSVLVLRYFEGKPQITVFFTQEATTESIESLQKMLEETGKTSSISFISKERALEIYREQNKDDPLLLEMVTSDILPASLEIQTKEPRYLADIETMLAGRENIEEVVFQKDVVDRLIAWTNAARLVLGALSTLLALDAVLILITITSMKIAAKREEIEILRLVGASGWYIRLPFLWEGIIYGMVGACISWGVIAGLILYLRPVLLAYLGVIPGIAMVLSDPWGQLYIVANGVMLLALLAVGFLLGSFGSFVAVNRYLKT